MKIAAWALILAVFFTGAVAGSLSRKMRFWAALPATARVAEGFLIAPDTARFIAAGVDQTLPPSFALLTAPELIGPVPSDWLDTPKFSMRDGWYQAFVPIPSGTSLYGTGEVVGSLRRNGAVTLAFNSDVPLYDVGHDHLYQSHPWVLAVRPDGTAFGVLADTTYCTLIDLRRGIGFGTRGHPFPVYVIEGDSPQRVVSRLAELTGRMPLPPRWALGYQQARWSYYPDAQVREIARGFRSRHLPCDVIWVDIHYMDDYRAFTFDARLFPDPAGLNEFLHGLGFKSVWMVDPGVKVDRDYSVYEQGRAGGHFVSTRLGREYHARTWAGVSAFPDYTRPETRAWWAGLHRDFLAAGIDGIGNDMNEPAVFVNLSRTMPDSVRHRGGGGLPPGNHALYHNVYGRLMARSTREGMLAARPDRRPFVLSRADYIGGQRHAATWTGDNRASWSHLRYSIPMILNLGLSGQPFSGADIGGFARPGTADLLAGWYGLGAFYPLSRSNADRDNIFKEPWVFGPATEESIRRSLQRRYRLLPYLYTVFREAATIGLPVMRPVYWADLQNPALRDEARAFLLGADLLVVPRLDETGPQTPALPRGIWRPITLPAESTIADPNRPELRLRGGAIIPVGPVMEYTSEKPLDPLTLLVCLDENGEARGELYEDAGDGFGHLDGDYLLTRYEARLSAGVVTVGVSGAEGRWPRPARRLMVEVITDAGVIRGAGVDGETARVELPVRAD